MVRYHALRRLALPALEPRSILLHYIASMFLLEMVGAVVKGPASAASINSNSILSPRIFRLRM